mmetsp:Transcript_32219/g.84491  ORF Transcript_32219/g.84491 Transcript_32219/m.84491 type:complete len:263 (-) Transcript_32219:445-1233(-)
MRTYTPGTRRRYVPWCVAHSHSYPHTSPLEEQCCPRWPLRPWARRRASDDLLTRPHRPVRCRLAPKPHRLLARRWRSLRSVPLPSQRRRTPLPHIAFRPLPHWPQPPPQLPPLPRAHLPPRRRQPKAPRHPQPPWLPIPRLPPRPRPLALALAPVLAVAVALPVARLPPRFPAPSTTLPSPTAAPYRPLQPRWRRIQQALSPQHATPRLGRPRRRRPPPPPRRHRLHLRHPRHRRRGPPRRLRHPPRPLLPPRPRQLLRSRR